MAQELPNSASEIDSRIKADIQRELSGSNPFTKNHWLGAIATGLANRIYDAVISILGLERDAFPDTAIGQKLIRWAGIWGRQISPATQAAGNIVFTGVAGAEIPAGSVLASGDVGTYTATSAAFISVSAINIQNLQRSGTTVTATTESDHGLANGLSAAISGASNVEYNTTANIIVTGTDEFQYQIVGSPPDEIGTSAVLTATFASVGVISDDFGDSANLVAGSVLTTQSIITDVDSSAVVDFNGVVGGIDQTTESVLRDRMLRRIRKPVANFNEAAVEEQADEVAGVTRVFVFEVTPARGQVTIYFMRDGDDNPIPSASQVNTVKNKILEIKPVTTHEDDVFVYAPVPVSTDFVFTDLQPNTSSMQKAIAANLAQFYAERVTLGNTIDQDAYRSAIYNTVDTESGDTVDTFTLSSPIGDIAIVAGEIGTLGNITIP